LPTVHRSTIMPTEQHYVFVGTKLDGRPGPEGPGESSVPVLLFDASTGALTREHNDVAQLPAPSWLTLSPSGRHLYAACRAETLGEEPTGVGSDDPADHFAVSFEVNAADGTLRQLNQQPTVGIGPTHCGTNGAMLVTAQYMGGSVTGFTLAADGTLLPTRCVHHHEYGSNANPVRQAHSYCHAAAFDHAGKHVLIPDLGADRLYCYEADAALGQLRPAKGGAWFESAPASGPRSVCFHATNPRWCYLITEIDSTIVPLDYEPASGRLSALGPPVCTIPDEWPGLDVDASGRPKITGEAPRGLKGNLTAHIEVSPDGRHVYGSNRGHDSIVCFAIDPDTGALSYVAHTPSGGDSPRAFAIHPSGGWLLVANEASGNVVVFARDATTGVLTQTSAEQGGMPTAMCLVFVPRRAAAV
jgi:6-phosphogluconolactonase